MENKYLKNIKQLSKLIGNTPFIKISLRYKKRLINVFAKLEWYNLSGSIKDRVALYILKNSFINGNLTKEQEIVEVSSGNTGISFACLGAYLGHKVTIIMPDWLSSERKSLLKMYGANLILISKKQGGFDRCFEILGEYNNAFKPRQFENEFNTYAHYDTTGREIVKSISEMGVKCCAFVAGVGTAGTLIGIAKALKEYDDNILSFAVEPKSSPILKLGHKSGEHLIEGISDGFIPEIYDERYVDGIIDASNEESIAMAQFLSKKLGLGVGISSGANFISAINLGMKNVVTVFPDDNKKYISTKLSKNTSYYSQLEKMITDIQFEII